MKLIQRIKTFALMALGFGVLSSASAEGTRAVLAANGYTGAQKGYIVGSFQPGANDYVVAFTNATGGTFTIAQAGEVQLLMVGGGGAGGGGVDASHWGGGGGAGGVIMKPLTLQPGTYSVSVGAGGTCAGSGKQGGNGGNTILSFGDQTLAIAYGGGGGGGGTDNAAQYTGAEGASGGGYGCGKSFYAARSAESVNADNLGSQGGRGDGTQGGMQSGGGGGGAGGQGCPNLTTTSGSQGGVGVVSEISGYPVYYGGGGGGNWYMKDGAGGLGGGGSGSHTGRGGNGKDGYGGGGGGSAGANPGGNGGCGVLMIRLTAEVNDNYVEAAVGFSSFEQVNNPDGTIDNVFVYGETNETATAHYFTLIADGYVRFLCVGGGGSGGHYLWTGNGSAGGGGGGGQVVDKTVFLTKGTYYVETGAGGQYVQKAGLGTGAGSGNRVSGKASWVTKEGDDTTKYVMAAGGGGGGDGTNYQSSRDGIGGALNGGGSGAGRDNDSSSSGKCGVGTGDFKSGGTGYTDAHAEGGGWTLSYCRGGGGAGAGMDGMTASATQLGVGGDGVYSDICGYPESDASAWYGGGGAGGIAHSDLSGDKSVPGGRGGGGRGTQGVPSFAVNGGLDGHGGGGGGAGSTSAGQNGDTKPGEPGYTPGGSGTVIVRILQPESILVDLQVTGVTSKGCNVKATLVGLGTEDAAARADVTISWGTTEECTMGSSTFNDCAKGAVCGCEISDLILGTKYFIKATAVRKSDCFSGSKTTTIIPLAIDPTVTAYFVTPDAPGGGNGKSWASPYTFQEAFNAIGANAAAGSTNAIYMKVGTYTNPSGPWAVTLNSRCYIRVFGGYSGVSLNRSSDYTILDGEGERGLVEVTVKGGTGDHGKSIIFDQVEFYRGKRAYYIDSDNGGNYFSRFNNCRFIDNIAPAGSTIKGSAIEVKGLSLPWVENCEFRGNKACTQYATTIFAAEPVSNWYYGLTLMNSLFVGNSSKVRPCVAHFGASENNNITIKSCTFAYNAVATEVNRDGSYATGANGGLVLDQRDYNGSTYIWDMTDTIFYGNRCNGKTGTDYRVEKGSNVKGQPKPQYLLFEKATAYVEEETTSAYADVDPNARHYIFGDPLFVTPLPAAVEFDANYNPTWYADSAKTVTVSPADMDVHLQSTKGRWNGSEWVIDANYSPAIDAGCPDSGFAEEPECNGGRINLGAYGNTPEASKSYDVTTEAATLSAATGCSELKRIDNGHAVLIYSNVTDSATFTVSEGGVARILVVGGGGNGGYGGAGYGGGGGGAGGVVEKSAMMLPAGTYTVVVGDSHQDSVLKDSSGTALITAVHGGNGGPGVSVYGSDRVDLVAGENGGSGGGAGGSGNTSVAYPGGTGIAGQGCDGSGGNYFVGHGGGGFSSAGTWGVQSSATGGDGGNGYVSDITGEPCGYACGGGGGDGNNSGNVGKGGYVTIGGVKRTLGGNGGTGSTVGQPGVAGTGSGGGGTSNSGSTTGGAGGSGIVVVQLFKYWAPNVSFSAEASDSEPTEATVTLNVTDLGCEGDVLAVLRWGTTTNCTEGAKILNGKNPIAIGSLVEELEGLIPGTKYYARVEFVRADRSVAEIAPKAEFTTKSVEASAYATLSGATGFSRWQRLDDGSTIFVFPNVTNVQHSMSGGEIGLIPPTFTLKTDGLARLLVVGGGGSGGGNGWKGASGGGGGGQVIDKVLRLTAGKYEVSVGNGGKQTAKGNSTTSSYNNTYPGNPSSVKLSGSDVPTLEALGGAGGGNGDGGNGGDGANGGGGSADAGVSIGWRAGAGGSGSIGFDGGKAWFDNAPTTATVKHCGGGGAGAGGFGVSAKSITERGAGGIGLYSNILGLPESDDAAWFGGGGAGGAGEYNQSGSLGAEGGRGGGASSLDGQCNVGVKGAQNTGGGGAGGNINLNMEVVNIGQGGSGIVVLRIYGEVELPVTLDLNDGTGSQVSATLGDTMPAVTPPTRSGYAFRGYSREWDVNLMTGKERDIITNGTLLYAYSPKIDDYGSDQYTLNGVAFEETIKVGKSYGNVTFSEQMTANSDDGYEGYQPGGQSVPSGSVNYLRLMRDSLRAPTSAQELDVTLGGLTVGQTYLMQLVCHVNRDTIGNNPLGLRVNGVDYECNTRVLQNQFDFRIYYFGESGVGPILGPNAYFYGRSFVLRFKATDTTYKFTLGRYPANGTSANAAIQINALQVRDITDTEQVDPVNGLMYYNANGEGLRACDLMLPTTLPSEPPRLYAQWAEAATLPEGKQFVYNGAEQVGVPAGEGEHYDIVAGVGSATAAGDYSVTLQPKEGYCWDFDGSDTNVVVKWSIARAQIASVQLSYGQAEYTGSEVSKPTVVSVTTVAGDVITSSAVGWTDPRYERNRVETPDFTRLGNISVVVTGTGNLTGEKAATFRIYDPTKIPLPRLTRTSYEYTGEDITPSFEPAPSDDTYTLSGVASTNEIGVYTVICTPKAGCSWENGQSGPYAVTWEIVRKQSFLERLAADPRRVNGEGETDFDTGLAQGGDLVYFDPADGAYIHIFTNTAAAAAFTAKQDLNAELLIVGGGGGGGGSRGGPGTGGGGGGAGGMVSVGLQRMEVGDYRVEVGAGGQGGDEQHDCLNGGSTFLKTSLGMVMYEAFGGGRAGWSAREYPASEEGKTESSSGAAGGSGGGHAALWSGTDRAPALDNGSQGHAGGLSSKGSGSSTSAASGGGGGGAGEDGGNGVGALGGKGGDGLPSTILGQEEWFAGGGAGSFNDYRTSTEVPSAGGLGGGGSALRRHQEGGEWVNSCSGMGSDGQGGGGAGGTGTQNAGQGGGRGGSGIVIIRYAAPQPIKVAVPTAKTGLFYNGMTQVGVPEGYGYTLSDYYSTTAGTFTATATLDYGYVWEDGVTDLTRTIEWAIAKVGITGVLLADYEATYDGTPKTPQIAAVMTDNGLQLTDATAGWAVTYERERVVTDDVTNEGRLQVVVTGKDSLTGAARANYRIVNPNKIALPRPTDVFKYTGAAITPTFTPAGGYTMAANGYTPTAGTTIGATAVGTYTVTCTLENGKTWENGSTEPYDVTWQIVDKTFLERLAADEHKVTSSPIATGGDLILNRGNTYIHVFTNTSEIANFTPGANLNARVLLVGGGGAGGYGGGNHWPAGSGGGAGGMVEANGIGLAQGNAYAVQVGAGASAATTANSLAACGSDSWFKLDGVPLVATAIGGGGGSNYYSQENPPSGLGLKFGQDGGSGGGGNWDHQKEWSGSPGFVGGNGVSGQGHAGGLGGDSYGYIQGGGGGAGTVGFDGDSGAQGQTNKGFGGNGRCSDILGFEQYFAGGGGGGGKNGFGVGGLGGGGNGRNLQAVASQWTSLAQAQGENGLGGGGGGGSSLDSGVSLGEHNIPGRGGDGIVIIAYEYVASGDSEAPVPESWKMVRQLNENGKIQVGVEAAAYGSTLSSNYYAGAIGEYTAIATLAPGYTKWSDGETAPSREIKWEIVEPGYTLRVIRNTEDAPTIWVPEKWLKEAFPDAEVTQAAYQQKFLEKNQGGVAAWHAYVLGFAADEVDSAAIVEESVQNTNPLTVTIRLRDWEVREANKRTAETGCTLKYTLISARTPGELMTGGGTVVTNLAGKAYERCEKSTFEAPLSDLDDENPVNYYRIKIHFIFGGGDE